MIECLECGKPVENIMPKYFCITGDILVPNEYYLCDTHKDKSFSFEDIYNSNGIRRKKKR